jgi:OOP family OmpA-OmpF porin
MISLCRLLAPLFAIAMTSGCSSIHNAIGPEQQQSDLRTSVEAPLEVADAASPFCDIPDPSFPEAPRLARVSDPQQFGLTPEPFTAKLYFLLDQTVFTESSQAESVEIYQEILDRQFSEVTLSGHTDTSASNAYNESLSLRRAEKVRQDLIDKGVPADSIKISAEGEYRLLVSTPDETVEVLNRRVEINAR